MNDTSASTADDLTGTVAIVTGASRGFGRAISSALVGAGARVIGVARDRAALAETADTLGEHFTPIPPTPRGLRGAPGA